MSEKKARKTRLKGTEKEKTCLVEHSNGTVSGCRQTKDRFVDFKPRWRGCAQHKNDRGRRYFQEGCVACLDKLNSAIRQPYCVDCDKTRPKKSRKKLTSKVPVVAKETKVPVVAKETEVPVVAKETEVTVVPQTESSKASVKLPPEPKVVSRRPVIASAGDLWKKLFDEGADAT